MGVCSYSRLFALLKYKICTKCSRKLETLNCCEEVDPAKRDENRQSNLPGASAYIEFWVRWASFLKATVWPKLKSPGRFSKQDMEN